MATCHALLPPIRASFRTGKGASERVSLCMCLADGGVGAGVGEGRA